MFKVNSIESTQLETPKQWLEREVKTMIEQVTNTVYQELLNSSLKKVINNSKSKKIGVLVRKFIKEVSLGYNVLNSSHNAGTQQRINNLEVSDTTIVSDEIAAIKLADLTRILSEPVSVLTRASIDSTRSQVSLSGLNQEQDAARRQRIEERKKRAAAVEIPKQAKKYS